MTRRLADLPRRRRLTGRLLLAIALTISTTSGCELGRTMFSMSSDSPMPMLGFNLLPKRKSRTESIADRAVRARQTAAKASLPARASNKAATTTPPQLPADSLERVHTTVRLTLPWADAQAQAPLSDVVVDDPF